MTRMFRSYLVFGILMGLLSGGLSSCKTSRKSIAPAVRQVSRKSGGDNKKAADRSRLPRPAQALLNEADSWLGTPYRYGGNDRNGVDCSGLVTQVFYRAHNIKLPRVSAQQSEYCTKVGREELQPGDLVFFHSPGSFRVSHVGLYVGQGNMIHASTSQGVIMASLDLPYFVNNYVGAGRVPQFQRLLAMENEREVLSRPTIVIPEQSQSPVEWVEILPDFFD